MLHLVKKLLGVVWSDPAVTAASHGNASGDPAAAPVPGERPARAADRWRPGTASALIFGALFVLLIALIVFLSWVVSSQT